MQTSFYQNGIGFTASIVWPMEYNIITESKARTLLNYFVKIPWPVEGEYESEIYSSNMTVFTCLQWVLTV